MAVEVEEVVVAVGMSAAAVDTTLHLNLLLTMEVVVATINLQDIHPLILLAVAEILRVVRHHRIIHRHLLAVVVVVIILQLR